MADSNGKAEIDFINVKLAKFGVHTITLLANSIRKTRCKCAIDDFIKCSNNNLITSLITNIRAKSATSIEESLSIYCCQVNKLDRPDIGNIDHIKKDIVSSWQEIICRGGQLKEVDTNMDHDQYKSDLSGYPDSLTRILKPIIDEIKMSEEYLTKIEYSHLSKNPQVIILYNIIQDRLSLNHLQKVVVEEVLNYVIFNKENQYHHRSKQLLLYVRRKEGVGKNRIVKLST